MESCFILQASESDLKDYEGICSKDNIDISEDFKKKVRNRAARVTYTDEIAGV